MKIIPKIICLLLAGMITLSGFPIFLYEDISRDNNVDLQDVILVVKQVAKTIDSEKGFKDSVVRALSTINVAAEFVTKIKPIKDSGNFRLLSFNDFPYLISNLPGIQKENNSIFLDEISYHFKSNIIPIKSPPPKII